MPEIKGAVGEPEVLMAEVDQVLETLVGTCYYLTWTRNRYRFSLSPNLNQMLVTKRAAVQKPAIDERGRQEIETVFKAGSPAEIDRRYWPARSNDVPDRALLTLLVLGMDTVAGEASTTKLMETILRDLQRSDEVTDSVGASRLVKFWPGACVEWSTKAVRDAFYSSPLLPRLLKPDSIKRTIADGVSQAILGYGRKDASGQFRLERYDESLSEQNVEIADDVFIVTGEEAKRRKEPPKLARIAIRPERVTIKPGEHPVFFKATLQNKPVGDAERTQMTELLRRIRRMADNVGRGRGRPILIAIRVPDSVEYCRAIGLDIEKWLADDLLDLMIASGYFKLNDWEYIAALGHKYGVKAYPSLDESRVGNPQARQMRMTVPACRGRATNEWAAGADGVYVFNLFDPRHQIWREAGDPAGLANLDRDCFASVRGAVGANGGNRANP